MSEERDPYLLERPCAACGQPIDLTGGAYTLSAGGTLHPVFLPTPPERGRG